MNGLCIEFRVLARIAESGLRFFDARVTGRAEEDAQLRLSHDTICKDVARTLR